MKLLRVVVAVAIAVVIASKLMPGVRVRRTTTAAVVGVVFGVLNLLTAWLVKPLIAILMLPVGLLTLGLAYLFLGFIVNTILLWATDKLVEDFEITSFGSLLGTSAIVSGVAWVLQRM